MNQTESDSSDALAKNFVICCMVAIHFVFWSMLMLTLWWAVPPPASILKQFDVEISTSCRQVIIASDTVVSYWYLFLLLIVVFALFDFAMQKTIKNYPFLIVWHILMISIPVICLMIIPITMLNTLAKLVNALS